MLTNRLQAEAVITKWQAEVTPAATIVLLDQPTIVTDAIGAGGLGHCVTGGLETGLRSLLVSGRILSR